MSDPLVIGLVAGESSGDTLGAALLEALRHASVRCALRIAGPKMRAAGCEVWADSHELAVMGLIEPLVHLPRLIRLRGRLVRQFTQASPHVFVGIDARIQYRLEAALRARASHGPVCEPPGVGLAPGAGAQHRQGCDLVLCLFPFETEFYSQHGVRAEFVGHPLADQIPLTTIARPPAMRWGSNMTLP